MCLTRISKRKPVSTGFGYKVYKNTNISKRITRLEGAYNAVKYKLGKLYKAQVLSYTKIHNMDYNGMTYKLGFHIYKSLTDAQFELSIYHNTIVKVKYSGAHTIGKGCDDESVVVADKITLIEVVDTYKYDFFPVAVWK